jgi:DNA-binding transcriptional MerR regulator
MSKVKQETSTGEARQASESSKRRKALTIGAVAKILKKEFDDISISKIRYLEDQKLVNPRRTPGGYRLYSQDDVDRLRTILRLQRDEFLPLRVIRQELATRRVEAEPRSSGASARRARLVTSPGTKLDLAGLAEETGVPETTLKELGEFGLVEISRAAADQSFDETDVAVVRAVDELNKAGIGVRNLRMFRTSADREAQMVEALLAARLQSKNPQRRKEAVQSLERMTTVMGELRHSLLVRDLRRLAES